MQEVENSPEQDGDICVEVPNSDYQCMKRNTLHGTLYNYTG